MEPFNVFLIFMMFLTVALVGISLFFSKRTNAKKERNSENEYVKKRTAAKEWLKREKYIMGDLKCGKIKCHKLKNSAPPYNVENWVDEMGTFMRKPIYKKIMELKGQDHNEEH